jgi:hypothetical protein
MACSKLLSSEEKELRAKTGKILNDKFSTLN